MVTRRIPSYPAASTRWRHRTKGYEVVVRGEVYVVQHRGENGDGHIAVLCDDWTTPGDYEAWPLCEFHEEHEEVK